MCSGYGIASVFIGVVSTVLAAGLAITSYPVFLTFYNVHSDESYKATMTIWDGIDKAASLFGIHDPVNPSKPVMMLLVSSGATLFAAGLQALAALHLCCCSAAKTARDSVVCYSLSSLICLVACVGSALASMQYFNILDSYWSTVTPEKIQYWQYATVINAAFLLFAWLQATYYACSNRSQPLVGPREFKYVASNV